jgi:hypothetical protein
LSGHPAAPLARKPSASRCNGPVLALCRVSDCKPAVRVPNNHPLLVRPDTILRWHRDLLKRRHAAASVPRRRGRPRTVRSICTLVVRLTRENTSWGYRASTANSPPSASRSLPQLSGKSSRNTASTRPQRLHTTWAGFLRSQSEALLACDFFETRTLVGARLYVFAVIEHATRRIRILGATAPSNKHSCAPAPRTDNRSGPAHPPRHPPTRSTKRHPPRVPACCLTSTDDYSARAGS